MPKSGLLFVAQNASGGKSLFQSDGSAAGTRELAALPSGTISGLQALGNGLAAFQIREGSYVWLTEGPHPARRCCPGPSWT
jgi:ELWxxDGT repeat protein